MSKNTKKELNNPPWGASEFLVRFDKVGEGRIKAVYPHQPGYKNAQYGFALIKTPKAMKLT